MLSDSMLKKNIKLSGVKRLRKRLSGELDVISDNLKYPVETFKPDADIEIIVKGRVVKNLSRGL